MPLSAQGPAHVAAAGKNESQGDERAPGLRHARVSEAACVHERLLCSASSCFTKDTNLTRGLAFLKAGSRWGAQGVLGLAVASAY